MKNSDFGANTGDSIPKKKGPDNDGSRLNAIADEFRNGRNVRQILVLLDTDNAEPVSIGAWLLSEGVDTEKGSDEAKSVGRQSRHRG